MDFPGYQNPSRLLLNSGSRPLLLQAVGDTGQSISKSAAFVCGARIKLNIKNENKIFSSFFIVHWSDSVLVLKQALVPVLAPELKLVPGLVRVMAKARPLEMGPNSAMRLVCLMVLELASLTLPGLIRLLVSE